MIHGPGRGTLRQSAWPVERVGLRPEHARRWSEFFRRSTSAHYSVFARALALNPKSDYC
ncbi:hypothetical protein KCP70_20575 [Salmonella enterica subsp. enterica]|nr:hypothetical protein KCP70_20575 [Salmonella enterica subsp. enterica]